MARAIVLVLDSFGIGASQDAVHYGDEQSDTFGHIASAFQLKLPNLYKRGLAFAHLASTGVRIEGVDYDAEIDAAYGYAVEQSLGKDTPSGHWEMMGVPVHFDWGYFPPTYPSFPDELLTQLIQQNHLPGILGNKHASGTEIINELGDEHIRSGKPIVYTSADSVLQIAAHEQSFGLDRLLNISENARKLVDPYNIGRVIARPFIGEKGHYTRTANRRDYATPPPENTLLDLLIEQQHTVIAIGKIADIFAHRGVSKTLKADGNMALFDATLNALDSAPDGSLVFTNFVDFDSCYGHRRDVAGYAKALEQFDQRLPELDKCLQPDDIVIMSADHGCDPSMPGSDHTREHIPVLAYGPNIKRQFIGRRESFADIGQSVAKHLLIAPLANGVSFL